MKIRPIAKLGHPASASCLACPLPEAAAAAPSCLLLRLQGELMQVNNWTDPLGGRGCALSLGWVGNAAPPAEMNAWVLPARPPFPPILLITPEACGSHQQAGWAGTSRGGVVVEWRVQSSLCPLSSHSTPHVHGLSQGRGRAEAEKEPQPPWSRGALRTAWAGPSGSLLLPLNAGGCQARVVTPPVARVHSGEGSLDKGLVLCRMPR